MYQYLIRKGYEKEFRHAGVYCIKANDEILYIGKSDDMLRRLAEHYVGIKTRSEQKYDILATIKKRGYRVSFRVMYNAVEWEPSAIEEEIGRKEGELIRAYMPALNTQIPKEENWRTYKNRPIDREAILARF